MRSDGPAVKRLDTLQYLWRTTPAWGSDAAPPANLLAVCQLYSGEGKALASEAATAMQSASQSKAGAAMMGDNVESIFASIAAGDEAMSQTLVGKATELYGKKPEVFEVNVEVMLDKMDFM
jgi:hypothetical protein